MLSEELEDYDIVIESFEHSAYSSTLTAVAKQRYLEKLCSIKSECPYKIRDSLWFHVYRRSVYTEDEMRNYKSCKSWKILHSEGMFFELRAHQLHDGMVLLKAKVHHSMTFSQAPLRPWVAIHMSGVVACAHCDCVAGLGECCSHVGALVFAAVFVSQKKNKTTCTDKPCRWLERSKRPIMVDKVSLLNKTKKNPKIYNVDDMLDEDFLVLLETLKKEKNCSLLSVLPEYCQEFIPKEVRVALPPPISSLQKKENIGKNIEWLKKESKASFHVYDVTREQSDAIEEATRSQARSELWTSFRRGRITASQAKSMYGTFLENPSKAVVMKSCYPALCKFRNDATKWGIDHEKKALKQFLNLMENRNCHKDYLLSESGLRISTAYPFLAASPDAVFDCSCHGRSVVEVKCPFKHSLVTVREAATIDNDFCLCMLVCDVEFCYFVVYTTVDLVILRIAFNRAFTLSIIPKLKAFAETVLLPEMLGKYFTETSCTEKYNDSQDRLTTQNENAVQTSHDFPVNDESFQQTNCTEIIVYVKANVSKCLSTDIVCGISKNCYVKQNDSIVNCSSQSCSVKKYHRSCLMELGKKRFDKNWICDACRKIKNSRPRIPLKVVN